MISDADRAAIDAAVAAFDVSRWAPLNDTERDLVSRALTSRTSGQAPERASTNTPGREPGGRTGPGRSAA